jgi:hypothetical protein
VSYQPPSCSVCAREICAGFVVDNTTDVICTTCICMALEEAGRETLSLVRAFNRLREAVRRVAA